MNRNLIGGFTLLEVMVAMTILAIALTAIFSSEAGSIRVAARAQNLTTATLLARCKMGELEEMAMREGMPAVGDQGDDNCCEDGEMEGFRCEWALDRLELPDAMGMGDEDGEAAPGAVGAASSFGAGEGADGISAAGGNSMQDALAGGGSSDMLASFALELAFPAIRPMIEDQVRRATVTVVWNEGSDERSFDVTQYIVAQQGSGNAIGAMGGGTTPVGNTPVGNNTQGTSQ